jgi:basic membrane protein A
MKKGLAKVLALVMAASLVGCGGSKTTSQQAAPAATETKAAEKAPAETKAEAPEKSDGKKVNVVLVIPNSLGDKAFSDMVWAGVQMAKEQNPQVGNIKCIELQGDTTTPVPTMTELAETGDWDIIVSGTFSLKESIENVAEQFPDQKFIIYDTELNYENGAFANCASFAALQNEGSFLGGALAALMSKSGVIGFVGGKETTSVSDFLVGYIEGAQYVNPDIVVRSAFIGNFTDTAKAKELAMAQNAQGADVVFAVCSGAGPGVYEAAANNGFWALGVDSDQSLILEDSYPDSAKAILTSVVKNFDIVLSGAINDVIDGNFEWGKHNAINLAAGGIGISDNKYYEESVPEDIRKQIDEIAEKIKSGEINVSTAVGMDADTYNALKDSVS